MEKMCDVVRKEDDDDDKIEVLMVVCGGTIDKDYPRTTKGYAFEFGDEPGITRVLKRVQPLEVPFKVHVLYQKDSQDMTKEDRMKLMNLCRNAKQNRILITHGTDTMIESAVLLGQANLQNKSIVLTGSMRPQRFENTDAHFNVGYALGVLSLIKPGSTMVCMNGMARAWNQVRRCLRTGKFVRGTPRAIEKNIAS